MQQLGIWSMLITYCQARVVGDFDWKGWEGECAIFGINRNWLVRSCGVAAHMADNAECVVGRG